MVVDGFSFLTPTLPSILEVADQLLFLGVETDNRPAVLQKELRLVFDVLNLCVPIRVLRASLTLGIGLERIIHLLQQPPHRFGTGWMAFRIQLSAQLPQAAPHPFLITRWTT